MEKSLPRSLFLKPKCCCAMKTWKLSHWNNLEVLTFKLLEVVVRICLFRDIFLLSGKLCKIAADFITLIHKHQVLAWGKCLLCTKHGHSNKCILGWWDAKNNCCLSPSGFRAQLELGTENWRSLGVRLWRKLCTLQEAHTVNTPELEIITLAVFSSILYWPSLLLTGGKR